MTPDVHRAFEQVVNSGVLRPLLGDELTLESIDTSGDQFAVTIKDRAQRSYSVTAVLPGVRSEKADGGGRHFLYYVAPSTPPNPPAAATLLAVVSAFDNAVPDDVWAACSARERSYPPALVLVIAAAEVAVVMAAIVFGLRTIDRSRSPSD